MLLVTSFQRFVERVKSFKTLGYTYIVQYFATVLDSYPLASVVGNEVDCIYSVQSLNTDNPILLTELGMINEDMLLQSWKAPLPMSVTELGMLMDASLEQPLKA